MRIDNYHLRQYLAREVLGKELPRKPPASERRGPKRNANYRAWIRTLPSVVSGLYGCEAAHTGSDGGMSMKASDDSCIPLTPAEHREYHQIGKHAFARRHRLKYERLVRQLNREWKSLQQHAA